jgi:hypothetical protein
MLKAARNQPTFVDATKRLTFASATQRLPTSRAERAPSFQPDGGKSVAFLASSEYLGRLRGSFDPLFM